MTAWRLTDAELRQWIDGLIAGGRRVLAPVQRGGAGGLRTFEPIAAADEACLDAGKTRWSPKEHLFPRTEQIFAYRARNGSVDLTPAPRDDTPQVLVGVRPCDAAGLTRLDAVFATGPGDPLFEARRHRSAIVSFACTTAEPECFCAAVGGHPAGEEGADVIALPAEGGWLVRPLTERGTGITATLASHTPVSEAEWVAAQQPIDRLAESMAGDEVAQSWAAALEQSFDAPLWEAVGQRCLGCSICNYLCPSCSCYDVQDSGSAYCGERCRSWDSCTFALFTKHGSGHNPRATQASRYRQRVLHKFSYYPTAHGGTWMCVGCGRCAAHCPVGLSIRDSAARIAAAKTGAGAA